MLFFCFQGFKAILYWAAEESKQLWVVAGVLKPTGTWVLDKEGMAKRDQGLWANQSRRGLKGTLERVGKEKWVQLCMLALVSKLEIPLAEETFLENSFMICCHLFLQLESSFQSMGPLEAKVHNFNWFPCRWKQETRCSGCSPAYNAFRISPFALRIGTPPLYRVYKVRGFACSLVCTPLIQKGWLGWEAQSMSVKPVRTHDSP